MDADVFRDCYVHQCCQMLAALVMEMQEQSLVRLFFHRDQMLVEDDEE